MNRCFLLYGSITDNWKPRDAELIGQFLTHGDYKKVAEALGKDTSLMWRRHNSLRMREYGELKNLMRDLHCAYARSEAFAPTIALKFVPAVEP